MLSFLLFILGLALVGNDAVIHASHCVSVDNQGTVCFFFVAALPFSYYVMRSFPLCGVRVLHSAQYDLTR